ncbi:hypothetical protein KRX57_08620 [Weeksellaceae bacterium TAE3-ERU29]|nr:hypothetical protein [Weeksellaceae bacterium TAE3-ERU29]
MKKNKRLKGCLIIISIIIILIVLFFGWFWWSMKTSHGKAEKDRVKYSKECDTITFITEKPSITIGKFHKTEIDELKFYIIRNNSIIQDTLIKYKITKTDDYLYTNIPFGKFKKSDTIIVETKNKKYFTISNFHHYAYLHYGMFGYLGSHDCRFDDENYMVNGKSSNGYLLKEDGLDNVIIPAQ